MKKITVIAAVVLAGAVGLSSPAAAAPGDYSKAKRNQFWKLVSSVEPMVKYAGRTSTINLGIATCDLLRAGGDLYDLAALLIESDPGIAEDSVMSIMAAAPVVLCPDQGYKFD